MRMFWSRLKAISQAEVIIALVIMSLVILASKNITESKFNYAKRVRAYAAWNTLSKIAGSVVSDGVLVEDIYNYKMISPIYKTTEQGSYLPHILNDVDKPAVHINGGFYDRLIEHFNVLESESGNKEFSCVSNCTANGYFSESNVKPSMYLSNGMTLFIIPTTYSFAMNNVAETAMVTDDFKSDLKCLNGLSGVEGCDRVAEISDLCAKIEPKSAPVEPWSTDYTNTKIVNYFKNIAECPACSNTTQTVKKYSAVPIFEYFHVLSKSLKVSPTCGVKSEAFLNEAFTRFLAGSYYDVFIDSDGPRSGSNTLNDDVFEFYVLLNGEVLPISSKMSTGDYLLANLYKTTPAGVRSLVSSGIPLPKAMCNQKFANSVFSYYAKNFIPIRNYCSSASVECPADASGCDYVPLRANVSVRGRSKK